MRTQNAYFLGCVRACLVAASRGSHLETSVFICSWWITATFLSLFFITMVSYVNFDRGVNFSDKQGRSKVSEGSAHHSEGSTEQGHVTEVESCLEQSVHSAKKEKVYEIF